ILLPLVAQGEDTCGCRSEADAAPPITISAPRLSKYSWRCARSQNRPRHNAIVAACSRGALEVVPHIGRRSQGDVGQRGPTGKVIRKLNAISLTRYTCDSEDRDILRPRRHAPQREIRQAHIEDSRKTGRVPKSVRHEQGVA